MKRLWFVSMAFVAVAVSTYVVMTDRDVQGPNVSLAEQRRPTEPRLPVETGEPVANATSLPILPKSTFPKPAELHARLWNAGDVSAAVRDVQKNGSSDEKAWAADLLQECSMLVAIVGGRPTGPDEPDDEKKRVREIAWEQLQKRCEGIKAMPWDQQAAMRRDLRAAAALSTSSWHTLHLMVQREEKMADTRWNQVEADSVTTALHGDDVLEKREAFRVLFNAIDPVAPGGQERIGALLTLMHDQIVDSPLSEFEQLEHCAMRPDCESKLIGAYEAPTVPTPESRALERLRDLYIDAFGKKLSGQQILAIR